MTILDASVVYKWIIHENDKTTKRALEVRNKAAMGEIDVAAPDLLLYEIANILVYKTGLSKSDAHTAWKNFLRFDIPIVPTTKDFITNCLVISGKFRISVYDASYVTLAKLKHAEFLTADRKLAQKVSLPFVRCLV